jgi:hypothetical protein
MNMWEFYNTGAAANMRWFDRSGQPYEGSMENFLLMHGAITGLRNVKTNDLIIINEFGEIAGKGMVP